MFLLLSQVSKVLGRGTSVDLACWNRFTVHKLSSSCKNCEALNGTASSDSRAHADVGEALQLTLFKLGVGSYVDVITDGNLGVSGGAAKS